MTRSTTRARHAHTAPREIELKLAVSRADLTSLRRRLAALGAARVQRVESVYYDTNDRLLARNGLALRLRRVGRRWVQTLKSGDARRALAQRGEWEMPAAAGRLDLAALAQTPLLPLLAAHGDPALVPLFTTRFERELRVARGGGSRIEVALDRGDIRAIDSSGAPHCEPLLELELELKSGSQDALFDLALRLVGCGRERPLRLLPFTESKAARGHRLAGGDVLEPVKAGARSFSAALSADDSVEAALRAVIARGTEIWLANAHGLVSGDDPEFVHQARVSLRRMRSAVRLWRREVAFPDALSAGLRWIAAELGAARDADVLVTATLPQLAARLPRSQSRALARLAQAADARRAAARLAARAAVGSGRAACLALALLRWGTSPSPSRTPMLRARALRHVRRARKRLLAAAEGFESLPPEQRHRVRILAKRLRYAVDLYAVALPAPPVAKLGVRLSELQDRLGELSDGVVALHALSDLGATRALRAAAEAALSARATDVAGEVRRSLGELQLIRIPRKGRPDPATG